VATVNVGKAIKNRYTFDISGKSVDRKLQSRQSQLYKSLTW